MKEDPNLELCKFLICKLGLDSLRVSSKLDFLPWFVSTKPCCYSNKPWMCKPNVPKLVQSLSSKPHSITLPSSPSNNYFNRRDALKRRDRFVGSTTPLVLTISGYESRLHVGVKAVMKFSTGLHFPFSDNDGIAEKNGHSKDDCVAHQLGSGYSFKDQFVGKFRSYRLPQQDSPTSKDIMQLPSPNGLSIVHDVDSNDVDDECWKTFNLTTPKGEGVETIFNEDGKEDSAHNQASTYRKRPNNTKGKSSTLPIEKLGRKYEKEIEEKIYSSPLHLSTFGAKDINNDDITDGSFKDILVTQKCHKQERSQSEQDELCVEEIEGESLIAKLRRQVKFDRKMIIKLYEEIDKERNAAAEAASQAMAMITKLQEEKALIDLDAVQCVRMMEEQAEHYSEALENANDVLDDKEKEIQDLEAELLFYRSKYADEYKEETMRLRRQRSGLMGDFRGYLDSFSDPITP